jgi:hypothetical protein
MGGSKNEATVVANKSVDYAYCLWEASSQRTAKGSDFTVPLLELLKVVSQHLLLGFTIS